MSATAPSTSAIISYLHSLQDSITAALERVDGGATFRRDTWERPEGGGGESRVLREGKVFEQAGVNFSHVMGGKLPASATAQRPLRCAAVRFGKALTRTGRTGEVGLARNGQAATDRVRQQWRVSAG